ncbi:unnamed protein product [Parnassius mnemosyne]|uniref:Uncharacterized protein n=2 Tax=Parnassius mnemosyne TaxID=213953 RepID=A0AAV1KPG8_9NEOP
MSGDLKFDQIMVDTSEALEYVTKNKRIFHSIGYQDMDMFHARSAQDVFNNNIIYADYDRPLATSSIEDHHNKLTEDHLAALSNKLQNLATNIFERKMLFAQIEYEIRKISVEETINHDIKLIVSNLLYVSSSPKRKYYKSKVLVMNEKSPLATLGFVAQLLCAHENVIIEATVETAVLCHLFTEMCHQVGLNNIYLAFVAKCLPGANDVTEIKELQSCCMGVVTERSDIDSAVDVFLTSSVKFPWKISRILVQEAVSDRFKNTLAWKAKLNPSNVNSDELKSKCSSFYGIGNKTFLSEFYGDGPTGDYVMIEEYRTVKELLSLSKKYKPFSVSLWCSDVSESNEIAYGIDSTIVWINSYGSFGGPPKSSQAFYSIIDIAFSKIGVSKSFDLEKLLADRDKWIKLSAHKKLEILNVAFETARKSTVLSGNIAIDSIDRDENFARVENGEVCIGLEIPVGLVLFHDKSYRINDILPTILKGNAVLYCWSDLMNSDMYSLMRKEGVPLNLVTGDKGDFQVPSQYSMYKIKVVRTNFGTIFAN